MRCAVSQPTPKEIRSVVGSSEHLGKVIKYPQW